MIRNIHVYDSADTFPEYATVFNVVVFFMHKKSQMSLPLF